MNWRIPLLALSIFVMCSADNCTSSDDIQHDQQEAILKEGTAQVGMPAIKNFRERKLLKDIYEMRDQDGLVTYTYLWNEFNGRLVFFCDSVGYGIPYATEFTNPEKWEAQGVALPQADPNGLFSPATAEGTWVLCKDPHGNTTQPTYVEPRIIVSPFRMDAK